MYKLLGIISVIVLSYGVQAVLSCDVQAKQELSTIEKPNVIIFYVDDLGWQDTQLNNLDEPTPWETPNILALSKNGMNFSQAYSPAPTCAPSRGGLLSGQHPAKTNLTHVTGGIIPRAVNRRSKLIGPYYNEHLSHETLTLAEALRDNGYKTGHVGKWHLGKQASNFPLKNGFDFSFDGRGIHSSAKDRSKEFDSPIHPLSKEKYAPFSKKNPKGISYPLDDVTENALSFVNNNKDEPFFLYLAHWMVHAPIVTKNKALLEYYTDKLGVPFPTTAAPFTTPGQTNPYYGAMVTTIDWSLGRLVSLLENTDDPRNPGKKLIETTYVFFTSDNGGAVKKGKEIVTDNAPLSESKGHVEEGGIKVPMVVTGPTLAKNVTHNGLVNQLDYYPTILALTQSKIAKKDKDKLSGVNLSAVFEDENKQATFDNGEVRKNMFWHFPHHLDQSMQSGIREGDFKLSKHYLDNSYSLYRLYKDDKRFDIEEANDLAKLPEYAAVVKKLSTNLETLLKENNAFYPNLNPLHKGNPATRLSVPEVASNSFNKSQRVAEITLVAGKTKLREAYLLVALPTGKASKKKVNEKERRKRPLYKKLPIEFEQETMKLSGHVPKGHDAYVVVLIDENNFVVTSDRYESL